MIKVAVLACVLIALAGHGAGHARIVTTQKFPIYVGKPHSLTTFELTDCWSDEPYECEEDPDVGVKIAIFGGAFVGKQVIRLHSVAASNKLHFGDVDGHGVREFLFLAQNRYKTMRRGLRFSDLGNTGNSKLSECTNREATANPS